ncbi:MAG: cytidylyltransferase domain-containing protein, partial [Cetobacterium sp.]
MKFLGVIPARYESTRLPRKPLKDICGHSMIEWVYKRAMKSNLDEVIVATDSQEVFDAVKSFGGEVILTDVNHLNG